MFYIHTYVILILELHSELSITTCIHTYLIKPGIKIAFVHKVKMCVRVRAYVCFQPEAIDYILIILNLYINVSKFATCQNTTKQFYPWA